MYLLLLYFITRCKVIHDPGNGIRIFFKENLKKVHKKRQHKLRKKKHGMERISQNILTVFVLNINLNPIYSLTKQILFPSIICNQNFPKQRL